MMPDAANSAPAGNETRLILLGTKGGPRPSPLRSNPANLILSGGTAYLVDCGYGTTRQLLASGVQPHELGAIFITHHHSDHTLELGPLLYHAWIGGLRSPIDVFGPPPLAALIDGLFAAFWFEIATRMQDEGRGNPQHLVRVHEIGASGVVLEAADIRVTAGRVHHPPLQDAYAYRFDTTHRSLVLSGDTAVCPDLLGLARRADVLVHEVMRVESLPRLIAGLPNARELHAHLLASHTTTEQVGAVASQAEVGTLVLNHFVPGDDPAITEEMWIASAREAFGGLVIAGRDLLEV
ncbi:MBL fold metallo-hydrolase [Microvirga sp. GCM10011540]|uniref:MBL fold metallo-hydrolase n=1 Tax=Microvirga sp. GCM10011540 TaxID=3317338 RepID=UPI00361AA3B3